VTCALVMLPSWPGFPRNHSRTGSGPKRPAAAPVARTMHQSPINRSAPSWTHLATGSSTFPPPNARGRSRARLPPRASYRRTDRARCVLLRDDPRRSRCLGAIASGSRLWRNDVWQLRGVTNAACDQRSVLWVIERKAMLERVGSARDVPVRQMRAFDLAGTKGAWRTPASIFLPSTTPVPTPAVHSRRGSWRARR
jgi:hypothetical protein